MHVNTRFPLKLTPTVSVFRLAAGLVIGWSGSCSGGAAAAPRALCETPQLPRDRFLLNYLASARAIVPTKVVGFTLYFTKGLMFEKYV